MTLTLLKIRSKKYIIRELLKLIHKGEQIADEYQRKNVSGLKDEIDNWQSEINIFYRLYTDNSKINMLLGIISIPRSAFEDRDSFTQRQQQIRFQLNRLYERIKENIDELRGILRKIERNEYETVFIKSKYKRRISRKYKKFQFYILSILALIVIYTIIAMYGILKFELGHILAIITIMLMIYHVNKKG